MEIWFVRPVLEPITFDVVGRIWIWLATTITIDHIAIIIYICCIHLQLMVRKSKRVFDNEQTVN